jgi:hypothetical protein
MLNRGCVFAVHNLLRPVAAESIGREERVLFFAAMVEWARPVALTVSSEETSHTSSNSGSHRLEVTFSGKNSAQSLRLYGCSSAS